MKPLDEFLEHRLLDRFHYDDRQDDGYGPDSPRVGDKGWITWEYPTGDEGVSRPFEIVRDDEHVRSEGTGLPVLMVGMMDDGRRECAIRDGEDVIYMSLLEADLDGGASLTLMERAYGHARWHGDIHLEGCPIDLYAPDGKPVGAVGTRQTEPGEWRIYDMYDGRPLDGALGETITDALRRFGYELEES